MKKIAVRAFAVQLIMPPSTCQNIMDGSRRGSDQFAAGRGLPRDDADGQRDRSGKADGCDAAGRKPIIARLPGALEDGAVRAAWHWTGADRRRNGALYGSGALLCGSRTH